MLTLRYLSLLILVVCWMGVTQVTSLKPPNPKHGDFDPHGELERTFVAARINELTDEHDVNPWEVSGLFEGDMLWDPHLSRNGILNVTGRWTNGTVPYYIEEGNFTNEEKMVILSAFSEYHNKTCLQFRPYRTGDEHWLVFRSNNAGCWSSVGMQSEGQVVNLHSPGCVKHGVVVHEVLHALGFFHQQSASDRDEYVRILWENIDPGHEHNFNKYNESNESVVTGYGVEYDYGSVMHYSGKAFSKNDLPTMEPLKPNITTLGQRKGLSVKDVIKLERMYEGRCVQRTSDVSEEDENTFIDEINSLYGLLNGSLFP
ncbi:seminal metalloprotease 1-like [Uranotaenia lowii]|uniref:seminal metalloprotease 1-like n=1 Tax=Uranotaenia lowii TaxID=190385 RepID=UPI0024794D94|nr:seminal metalloprotease 1-like [Uranotaenia lowii]